MPLRLLVSLALRRSLRESWISPKILFFAPLLLAGAAAIFVDNSTIARVHPLAEPWIGGLVKALAGPGVGLSALAPESGLLHGISAIFSAACLVLPCVAGAGFALIYANVIDEEDAPWRERPVLPVAPALVAFTILAPLFGAGAPFILFEAPFFVALVGSLVALWALGSSFLGSKRFDNKEFARLPRSWRLGLLALCLAVTLLLAFGLLFGADWSSAIEVASERLLASAQLLAFAACAFLLWFGTLAAALSGPAAAAFDFFSDECRDNAPGFKETLRRWVQPTPEELAEFERRALCRVAARSRARNSDTL